MRFLFDRAAAADLPVANRRVRTERGSPEQLVVPPAARAWLTALIVGIALEYLLFFVLFRNKAGPGDADQYLVFHSLQYWNAELFGLAKQWTPLLCSGLSMAGEPQIPFMSLAMALSYVLGPLWGVKLSLMLYCIAGWFGAYLYSQLWLSDPLQRRLAAALFVGNGFFFCRLGLGHFDFAPFFMLPFMLWSLHCSAGCGTRATAWVRPVRIDLVVALLGTAIALGVDGSPVTIIHLLFCVGLYALVLSVTVASLAPILALGCAVCCAAILDAGYLWPMVAAQADFPRLAPDTFTSFLSLLWFAVLPLRGKVLPANGNGHELSVFVGPVLFWCLWRSRRWLNEHFNTSIRQPLLVVSLACIVLGMGSLKGLHVPTWLSPFDALRPLPGFRSINVTGRYWSFLSLPLSLLAAAALTKTVAELKPGWKLHALLAAVLLFQLGFQGETLSRRWVGSPDYRPVEVGRYFRQPEAIDYVRLNEQRQQGDVMTPVRGVCDCYDMDDFLRPPVATQLRPVLNSSWVGEGARAVPPLQLRFNSWNRIEIQANCTAGGCAAQSASKVRIVLDQAFHADWHSSQCDTYGTPSGNLALECGWRTLQAPLVLEYRNALSEWAAHVSVRAWKVWICAMSAIFLLAGWEALRVRQAPAWHPVE